MNTFHINGEKLTSDTELAFAPNPKRPNSKAHSRYEEYQDSHTLGEYLETADKKYAFADLRYDMNKGFLKLIVDHDES